MIIDELRSETPNLSGAITNKLKRGELLSGRINLLLFSTLITIVANNINNVKLLFNSISQSSSLAIKYQGVVIELIK
jgi:hypothetical protein